MATFFPLPKLGMNQEEGEVVSWLVAEGDEVTEGQPIVEVETDKATVELESTATGVLGRIVARRGRHRAHQRRARGHPRARRGHARRDPRDHRLSARER